MALTREFKRTVVERVQRDPAFAKALLDEAATLFLNGEADTARLVLRDLVNATVTFASSEAKERRVEVIVEPICDLTLTGPQAGALREAFSNLVVNAVQAIEGGGQVKIESAIQPQNPNISAGTLDSANPILVLTVTDTGPGISSSAQQRVFEPFYSTKSRGTGLGLAIVRRRAVELGGKVELASPINDDRGTRFRLVIPIGLITEKV
jgi:signal transduction histidine kinase